MSLITDEVRLSFKFVFVFYIYVRYLVFVAFFILLIYLASLG